MCKCLQVYDWRGNCWEAWRTGIVYKNILPCGFGMFCWTKYLRWYSTYSGGCRKEVPGTGPQISHTWISSVLQWPCSQWFQYPLRIPPNWKAVLCLWRPGFFPWPVIPSNALHWLSRMPDEILDKNSPAWNKGRVHHTGAPYEVAHAYAAQFDKDTRNFLNARAKELVVGGIMVLIMSTLPDGTSPYRSPPRALYDILESCLMETVKAERQTIH